MSDDNSNDGTLDTLGAALQDAMVATDDADASLSEAADQVAAAPDPAPRRPT